MSIKRVTFLLLRDEFIKSAGQGDLPAQVSIANHVSALGDFIKDIGFDWSDEVGQLLRKQFPSLRAQHGERLAAQGRSKSYITNRLSLLNRLFKFLRDLDYEGASITGDLTPLQEALRPLLAGRGTISRTAREIKVDRRMLENWSRRGRIPQTKQLIYLKRLEEARGLPYGTLLHRLPARRQPPPRTSDTAIPIAHRKRLAERSLKKYLLKALAVPPNHRLRVEYPGFVRYKVEGKSSRNLGRVRGKVLSRALRSTGKKSWRTRELRIHWKTDESMAKRWPEVLDGLWVPTANRVWNAMSAFFGWALLAPAEGGAGQKIETLTLGNLADQDYLIRYLDWYMENSTQAHGGHVYFIDMVLMLIHAEDGFLPKRPDIGAILGFDADSWKTHCAATLDWIYSDILPGLLKTFEIDGKGRKPDEPIQHILDLERPLDALMRAINKADADRPTSGGEHEVAWARDICLMALLSVNPLRLLNFINLTYRPDNTGHLRQDVAGNWDILIKKEHFKNMRGAAKDRDYHQAVDPAMTPYITRYIRTYRPLLGGSRPELVFVSTDHPDREFDMLDRVVRTWTKRYLENCLGVGPNSLRHIVATHILKTTFGNIYLAAIALHDHEITVKKNYDHVLTRYADAGRFESYSGSTKILREATRSRVLASGRIPPRLSPRANPEKDAALGATVD
jgi:hypothetical protein